MIIRSRSLLDRLTKCMRGTGEHVTIDSARRQQGDHCRTEIPDLCVFRSEASWLLKEDERNWKDGWTCKAGTVGVCVQVYMYGRRGRTVRLVVSPSDVLESLLTRGRATTSRNCRPVSFFSLVLLVAFCLLAVAKTLLQQTKHVYS
jgi:hypothetical protein